MPPGGVDAVVLLSGGLDSATTLALALRDGLRCVALSVDYGQRHRHELAAAALVAQSLGACEHRVVTADLRAIGGSALTDQIPVPKGGEGVRTAAAGWDPAHERAAGPVPATYVPARNLIFLSLAVALAEAVGAHGVFIGANAVDYSGYPDCRPAFIESFERTAALATAVGVAGRPIRVHAPIITWTKPLIIRRGLELGVDFGLTHSCYDPWLERGQVLACGGCDACRIRAQGFADAGVLDPTRYRPTAGVRA